MSKQRILLVHFVIALILFGSLYHIVTDQEHWPFSNYPMFSTIKNDSSSSFALFGVLREQPHSELYLYDDPDYIQPFDKSRLSGALRRMSRDDPEKLDEALLDSLEHYESLRTAGLHNGPALKGIRLYRLEWRLDSTQATPSGQPDSQMIAEVEAD